MTANKLFSILHKKENSFDEVIIKNNLTNEFVSILPEHGAKVRELWLNNGVDNFSILKKISNVESAARDDVFTNAKLSPFAGRIKDGKYVFNGKEFCLPVNYPEENNACHGFLYDKKFITSNSDINEDNASIDLEYLYNCEYPGYPFNYTLYIRYILTINDGLICQTRIKNSSDITIPVSDGWHHYFEFGTLIDELALELDVSDIIEIDSQLVPTGQISKYSEFDKLQKIYNKHFDFCFRVNAKKKIITKLIWNEKNVKVNIWQDAEKYKYLVVYTPEDRKSIAIEPWTSNVNSFNNEEGLITLLPHQEYLSSFGIYLEKRT